MSVFNQLSKDERDLIVSLPYKTGIWISHADDERGEADDKKEQKALQSCLEAVLKNEENPFLSIVLTETLANKEQWDEWSEYIFRIPEEAEQALGLIMQKDGKHAARAYANTLLKLASAVAEAHGEFNSFDEPQEEEKGFGAFFGKIMDGLSGVKEMEDHHPMNISASEKQAIDKLKAVTKKVVQPD